MIRSRETVLGITALLVALWAHACGDGAVEPQPPPSDPPRPTTVTVTPATASLTALGATVQLVAEVRDQNGQVMAGAAVAWASRDPSVATVAPAGLVTAAANGTATITATAGSASGTATVTVAQEVSTVTVSPEADTVMVADTLRLNAEATDVNGHQVADADFVWSSSDTLVATVDSTGLVTAIGPGEVEIAAISSGIVGRAGIVVENPKPMVSIATPALATVEGGEAVIVVSVDTPPELALPVRYLLGNDDDADTNDADPHDYSDSRSGVVEIDAGTTSASIDISIIDDAIAEPTREVFEVALATPAVGAGYVIGTPASAAVTIKEGVCDRTPVIRNEILRQTDIEACEAPDDSALAAIRSIDICFLKYAFFSRPCDDSEESLIAELREGDFLGLSGLRTLSLKGHELGVLPRTIFAGLSELRSLTLWANGLTDAHLPSGLFSGLPKLNSLTLGHDPLTTLPPDIFSDLPHLRVLTLSATAIADLPTNLFRGLSGLTVLDLSSNNLAELSANSLHGLSGLTALSLAHNRLPELPTGLFSPLSGLTWFDMDANPGSPFALRLELARTDSGDPTGGGPARVKVTLAEGAPFPMDIGLSAHGAVLSADTVPLAAGATESAEVTITPDAGFAASVSITAVPQACDRCSGALFVAGNPLVLANPDSVQVSTRTAYLTQGTQNLQTEVPLIAGREALLRVFATANDFNSFNLEGRARFFRNGSEVYSTSLSALPGIPTDIEEGRLGLSLNARIPAHVLQPGLSLMVELDPDNELPLLEGSLTRFPVEGRLRLDVRALPPLELTIIPVSYHTEANRGTNAAIIDFARDLATSDSRETISRVRAVMPVGEMRVRLRDPYVTWADTTDGGMYQLLREIELIRHLETEGTGEYYHGLYAHPRRRVSGSRWTGGVAYLGGHSALSWWAPGSMTRNAGIARLFAHEFGHNLSLGHAPCNTSDPDPEFPYADGNIGVWGHTFLEPSATELGRLFHAVETTDVMTYCHDVSWWLSDYNFIKAFEHRLAIATGVSATRSVNPEQTLILWGGIDDGSPVLEAPFVYDARVKLPDGPGTYALSGFDVQGERLFSFSFEPDTRSDHAGGSSFLFAIPLDPDWIDSLDRVVLSGADRSASVSLEDARGPVIWVERSTGMVRGIAREWPDRVPAVLATDVETRRLEIVRGPPTRR